MQYNGLEASRWDNILECGTPSVVFFGTCERCGHIGPVAETWLDCVWTCTSTLEKCALECFCDWSLENMALIMLKAFPGANVCRICCGHKSS